MAQLGEMDDRALADIGLTRQDLRDATALSLGADPGRALAQRAQERESHVRRRRAQTQTKRQAAE